MAGRGRPVNGSNVSRCLALVRSWSIISLLITIDARDDLLRVGSAPTKKGRAGEPPKEKEQPRGRRAKGFG
jgi:hypothetical protein